MRLSCRQCLFVIALSLPALPVPATEIPITAYHQGVVTIQLGRNDYSISDDLYSGAVGNPGYAFFGTSHYRPNIHQQPFLANGIALFDLGSLARRISSGNLRISVGPNPSWSTYNTTETVVL